MVNFRYQNSENFTKILFRRILQQKKLKKWEIFYGSHHADTERVVLGKMIHTYPIIIIRETKKIILAG